MKDLIVSICAVAVLIGGWLIFAHASQAQIDDLNDRIREEIIPSVESAQWDEAYQKVQVLSDDWHAYKKTAIFFLDTQTINDIDYAMAKSVKYVKAEDVSNASGELFAMVEQLTFLCSNDEVNWGNVF